MAKAVNVYDALSGLAFSKLPNSRRCTVGDRMQAFSRLLRYSIGLTVVGGTLVLIVI